MIQLNNPFNPTFGIHNNSFITRDSEFMEVINAFNDPNSSNLYIITGLRGVGKTALLNNLVEYFSHDDEWITININPEENILEQIASGIYNNLSNKLSFTKKEISFSFSGISFKISGDEPISDINYLLRRLLKLVKDKNKKVLISIDEVSPNKNIKSFVHSFQLFSNESYPVYSLMTGLYENISSLENEKNLTFLYRAPKIELGPLSIARIKESYIKLLDISDGEAKALAILTNGYPFAYQVLGSLVWIRKSTVIDDNLLASYDDILSKRSYEKIWSELPNGERDILHAISLTDGSVSSILENTSIKINKLSVYRSRLIKRGLIISPERGILKLVLPRFKDFIINLYEYDI